eukprot:Awhi_evm1s13051
MRVKVAIYGISDLYKIHLVYLTIISSQGSTIGHGGLSHEAIMRVKVAIYDMSDSSSLFNNQFMGVVRSPIEPLALAISNKDNTVMGMCVDDGYKVG